MSQVKAIDTTKIYEARKQILANYFNVEPVIDRLEMFIAGNEILPRSNNVIFYGKGGYGKSEIAYDFIKTATGIEPFVVNINQATAPADLFGGMDIPELTQRGNLDYNFDNSFMAHEWVIFEEGLEARQKVLSALKYIITSGVFSAAGIANPRQIKTKGIIIVTNVDTADFMESDDTRAFIERFPITFKVGWEGLNQSARYQASFNVVEKFDRGSQLNFTQKRLIAENLSVRMESPRMISKVVQNMLTKQSMAGGGFVSDETFQFVMNMMGYADRNLAAKIEEERINLEVQEAKDQYEALFTQLSKNMAHYATLKDHINDPEYMAKVAGQIAGTTRLIDDIKASVVDIRINPDYGTKGSELASWINTRVGEFSDQLEDVMRESQKGMVVTIQRLVEFIEKSGLDIRKI